MKLIDFINSVVELKKWSSMSEYITEGDIREILSGADESQYLIIEGVPALTQTVILYLKDGVYYVILDEVKKVNEDEDAEDEEYVNAAHINKIVLFDREKYMETKRGLEFLEMSSRKNLDMIYNEEYERQNDITQLFEPKSQ